MELYMVQLEASSGGWHTSGLFFALAVNKISEYRVNSALKNGTLPKSKVWENEFVSRPQISEIFKKLFQPNEHQAVIMRLSHMAAFLDPRYKKLFPNMRVCQELE